MAKKLPRVLQRWAWLAPVLCFCVALEFFGAQAVKQGAAQEHKPAPAGTSFSERWVKVAARAEKHVVLIRVEGAKRRRDALKRDLFKNPEAGDLGSLIEVGAGVIVSKDGLVLTHASLVPFERPSVVMATARGTFKGRLLVRHNKLDAALLRIDSPHTWEPAEFVKKAPKAAVQVGDFVCAFGNPFGSSKDGKPSVSVGVVSGFVALRARDAIYQKPVYLTDISVNPGCYGGPVFNAKGQLLAIVSPLLSSQSSGALLRCAQPAWDISEQLKQRMKGDPPYLGIVVNKGDGLDGLPIQLVQPGSPADKAGLKPGDILKLLDRTEMNKVVDLVNYLSRCRAGDRLVITIRRGEQVKIIELRLGKKS